MAAGKAAVFHVDGSIAEDRKRRDLWEVSVGYALILLVIWTPSPWQRPLYWVAAIFILAVSWMSFDGWPAMGLRSTNLLRSLWVVGVALLAATVAVLVAIQLHTVRPWRGPVELIQRFWGYAIWAFLQQLLLQVFFLGRFLRLISSRKLAVLTVAGIFALAHLPSPILTVATLLWGLAACWLFLRYRNLYPLAIAHAVLGITLAVTCPGPVTHNMRVGLGYLTYSQHHPHHRSHKDHIVSTDACVITDAPTRRS
ncbi:MAG TPA: type II CAAX endopeptidase family protein [Silvibacterium sp.]|nr:type II CAAX endopeptidase family protein [Silvibacterium sp.]